MWSSLFLSLLKGTTIWSVLQTRTLENSRISSVQSLSHVRLFGTPWTAACQASLSITYSQSLLKLMSIELVMPSNHLILCHPLLLLPSIFPSIRVFSNESVLCIRWPNPSKHTHTHNGLYLLKILFAFLLSFYFHFSYT